MAGPATKNNEAQTQANQSDSTTQNNSTVLRQAAQIIGAKDRPSHKKPFPTMIALRWGVPYKFIHTFVIKAQRGLPTKNPTPSPNPHEWQIGVNTSALKGATVVLTIRAKLKRQAPRETPTATACVGITGLT